MRKIRAVSLGAFLAGAVLAVCGCGGDDTRDADVAGKWDFYMTQDGVPGEDGPNPRFIDQSGSSITVDDGTGSAATGTVSGNSVTFTLSDAVVTVTFTGTVSGTHMEGTWEGTIMGSPESGTWRAEFVSRAFVDVSEFWYVNWSVDGGMSGTATADLTMAPDGTITGDYDPDYGPAVQATGSLCGYNLTLTVVETDPIDRTITLVATVNAAGTAATGSWSDTVGNSGAWDADLSP